MAADETRAERQNVTEDYREMAKTWKDGYLRGLDACLQWQEENERLVKDTIRQGLTGSRQLLGFWKDWIQNQTEQQRRAQERTNGPANPLIGLTRQSTEAVVSTVEPILRNSEAAVESTFGYYKSAVAAPSRRYVREINEKVLEAAIPS